MKELLPFQKEDVLSILKMGGNCLLGSDMGTGKTAISITWMNANAQFPVLIVCPASLKYNWEVEIEEWGNPLLKVSVISKKWQPETITIVNYDILKKYEKQIIAIGYKVIIVDECHYISNQKAQRTKLITKICQSIPQKLFLSGTPMANRPVNLFPILRILAPSMPFYYRNQCENYWDFAKRFCNMHKKEITVAGGRKITILDDSGISNPAQLSEILHSVMIRRLKKDVLSELPPKNEHIIPICESDKDEEEMFKAQMARDEEAGIPPASLTEKYRQYAVMKKLEHGLSFIKSIADTEKVVVGIHHREAGNLLYKALSDYNPLVITGSMDAKARQEAVNSFQNDPSRKVIICSILAAGTGLTLTSASKMVILETAYTPSVLSQFSDRIHRIGQDTNVDIYHLVIRKSIDSAMTRLCVSKQKNINQIVDSL